VERPPPAGAALPPDVRLAKLTPSQYAHLSALLDDLLERPPAAREERLSELDRLEPHAAQWLRELLAAEARGRLEGFLDPDAPVLRDSLAESPIEGSATTLVGKTFGPYRVVSLLGHGGMGSVWLAERNDGLFTRRLALKLVHPALMGELMTERVRREREILASLVHPHIARLLDAGYAEDGQPYLALEYVAGVSLLDYCDRRRLPVRERLQLFLHVLGAVQYAHSHLVIHRDLKPSNVLVTDEGHVHLLDFGIAKLVSEGGGAPPTELTLVGGRLLTPDYAAPEQIAGGPITTAVDVYALGVMLCEMLTGERPYRPRRASRAALEEAILETEPVAPSRAGLRDEAAAARATTARKLARSLEGDLDTIVLKALKKSPGERYATANAFAEDIRRFLRGEAVLAQRDSIAYRTRKFAWRHRIAIAVAVLLLLTLAGGLAATSYEATIAAAQRDAALDADQRLLTQAAATRLKDDDVPGSLGIILEVLRRDGARPGYSRAALDVFEAARAEDAQQIALIGHTDRVRTIAYSPDGQRLVTASYDGTARVWDASTGRQLLVLRGHTAQVISAAFSPDGHSIATAAFDGTARIWDAASGRPLSILRTHADRLRFVAFSPDGQRLATASYDRTARIWDVATGRQLQVLSGHTALVTSAVFSPDNRQVATASYDKTARIWDAATGRQIRVIGGHRDILTWAAFSPGGRRLVTASGDGTARIWDVQTGRQLAILSGHTQLVASAVFSPDGRRVLTASYDETARIWDAATGQPVRVLSGHTGFVEDAVFSPDGRHVATASSDGTARIWDAGPIDQIRSLSGHSGAVATAAFSPDGRRIVTASFDRTARVWDVTTGRPLEVLRGHAAQVASAAFSPEGRRIVTASLDGTARIWDAATGRLLTVLRGHKDRVICAAFSPDGGRVLTTSSDKTARIWDAASGRPIESLLGHTQLVESGAFSPDGRRVVTAGDDNTARIWDASTGRELVVLRGHTGVVATAKFSPDGQRVLTASDDGTARIWDAATGRQIGMLRGSGDRVTDAEFSPDGRRIVTASADKRVRIWNAATGLPMKVLSGHTELVDSAAFSPDERLVVTASDDRTARIWDAGAPPLRVQIDSAEAARFDPLTSTERFALGLPAPPDVRRWPPGASPCDAAAAAPYDPDRRARGIMLSQIVPDVAIPACTLEAGTAGTSRSIYQRGRARLESGSVGAARLDFGTALAGGYRAAGVALGRIVLQAAARRPDVLRAVALFEQAWREGVPIAAYELGMLYERGVRLPEGDGAFLFAPDTAQARIWYGKAVNAGEPHALARIAARDEEEAAHEVTDPAAARRLLLTAFRYYAAAAAAARREDWPDAAWRAWRYHRASLARRLARAGLVEQVAAIYEEVSRRYALPHHSVWRRFAGLIQGREP
jgi:WD40 repeat protein/serine/threonine protein kinase